MSSRNNYLDEDQKCQRASPKSYIKKISSFVLSKTFSEADKLIQSEKLNNSNWDYLELLNPTTLESYNENDQFFLAVGALRVDGVKLLDNLVIEGKLIMFDQEYRIGHKEKGLIVSVTCPTLKTHETPERTQTSIEENARFNEYSWD